MGLRGKNRGFDFGIFLCFAMFLVFLVAFWVVLFRGVSWGVEPDSGHVVDGLKYEIAGPDSVRLAGFFDGNDARNELVVPGVIYVNGAQLRVVSVGEGAFADRGGLRSVSLPEGLASVGDRAFYGCGSLVLGSLPDGVVSIGEYAFANCGSLSLERLPEGITSIGKYSFSNCGSLVLRELPSGLVSIGEYAFSKCGSLSLKSLPDGVVSIGEGAFSGCGSLALTDLPEGLTSVESYSFAECKSLGLKELPAGVSSIGNFAFAGCSSLALESLPDGIVSIGDNAFWRCGSLRVARLPASLVSLGHGAFAGCGSMSRLWVGPMLEKLDPSAFYDVDGSGGMSGEMLPALRLWTNDAKTQLELMEISGLSYVPELMWSGKDDLLSGNMAVVREDVVVSDSRSIASGAFLEVGDEAVLTLDAPLTLGGSMVVGRELSGRGPLVVAGGGALSGNVLDVPIEYGRLIDFRARMEPLSGDVSGKVYTYSDVVVIGSVTGPLEILVEESFARFLGAQLDGKRFDARVRREGAGSVLVSFEEGFLESLRNSGERKVLLCFEDAGCLVVLNVVSPVAGALSGIPGWAIPAALVALVLWFVVRRRRRE